MSATTMGQRGISVAELQRAWAALQAGDFHGQPGTQPAQRPAPVSTWSPRPGERVLPVVGCGGSSGASTVAMALATAFQRPARVVECSSVTASGLTSASTAELGQDPSGWTQGTRARVLLERTGQVLLTAAQVPPPSTVKTEVELTVLDVAWDLGHVLATPCWVAAQVLGAEAVVLVTAATVPGMRRLEGAVEMLAGTACVGAVVGPRRRRWPPAVWQCAGPLTRALDTAGHLQEVPRDKALAVSGLDPCPLPAALLAAATTLLRLTGSGQTTPHRSPA